MFFFPSSANSYLEIVLQKRRQKEKLTIGGFWMMEGSFWGTLCPLPRLVDRGVNRIVGFFLGSSNIAFLCFAHQGLLRVIWVVLGLLGSY